MQLTLIMIISPNTRTHIQVMIGKNIDVLLDDRLVYNSSPPPLEIIIPVVLVIIILLFTSVIVLLIILRVVFMNKQVSLYEMEMKDIDGRLLI